MKIYFGFTVAGDRSALSTARRLVRMIEESGHEVLTRHLVEDGAGEADRGLGAQAVFARDMRWLEQCDAFVAEVSGSSFGMGFEAGYLLGGTEKPVILLYRSDAKTRISLLITGNTHARCTVAEYRTAEEAEEFLRAKLGALSVTVPGAAAKEGV